MRDDYLRDLIRRAKTGELAARNELFALFADQKAFGAMLLQFVRRRLPKGDPARRMVDSQDILVSALASAIGGLDRFRGEFTGQLFKFIHYALLKKLRKHRRAVMPALPDGAVVAEAESEVNFVSLLEETELHEVLFRAIGDLPLGEQLATWLVLNGETTESIAQLLDISRDAVRQRHHRALAKLKDNFRRGGFGRGWDGEDQEMAEDQGVGDDQGIDGDR